MQVLQGLEPLSGRYQGYIVDLWGTVHDGITVFPGAADCLARLRKAGKRIVFLSNAPRPAAVVHEQLRAFGIADEWHDGVVTSGEVTRQLLLRRGDAEIQARFPWLGTSGTKVLHIGGDHDLPLYEGLDLILTDRPEEARFIMNTGPDDRRGKNDPAPYTALLEQAAALKLPMICANPDMEVVKGGVRLICAGLLASIYEQKGGEVHQIGKPYPEVYAPVFEKLGLAPSDCLAIGDALATDIRGAKAAGADSLWVLGGIHGEHLADNPQLAQAEADGAGLSPAATVPMFRW
ncbi:TIGR01459 family HAD-type hydrolase [Acetobacter sp. AN02]|uniref:TIGR01459 family HAD-type hydrolase n=1 Tax=Acetobacter sp. AN02 TaxID=2894186 RepID=UPI0024346597|nr:TIGR01459 family HAD-type hydrolase [Acetobacter sp. AN02]MDG6095204.1 TIGR01459 family HAD-type hydrolase [Acetobacter sp. AN02]